MQPVPAGRLYEHPMHPGINTCLLISSIQVADPKAECCPQAHPHEGRYAQSAEVNTAGCRFYDRCPCAELTCITCQPTLAEVAPVIECSSRQGRHIDGRRNRVKSTPIYRSTPPLREQMRVWDEVLLERFQTVLLQAMAIAGLDMWLTVTRENNEDPHHPFAGACRAGWSAARQMFFPVCARGG